jgi:hypothetical protein
MARYALHYATSFHSSKRTTIRLFYIAHRGQSEGDSGRIVGYTERTLLTGDPNLALKLPQNGLLSNFTCLLHYCFDVLAGSAGWKW